MDFCYTSLSHSDAILPSQKPLSAFCLSVVLDLYASVVQQGVSENNGQGCAKIAQGQMSMGHH
jgi:hypothetical protein